VIVYGRNPVRESLRGRRAHQLQDVWATAGAAREPWLQGVALSVHSAAEIERRCHSSAHQGICAEAGGYPYVSTEELLAAEEMPAKEFPAAKEPADDPLIVVLDQVQDPHNLGSICRTAECVGATGVVIAERRSAEVTPTVCKTSAGAVEHLRVARTRNVADFLAEAKRAGCWCYGAAAPAADIPADAELGGPRRENSPRREGYAAGKQATVSYAALDYRGGVVLVLGSEGSGLRPRVAANCDRLVALPLRGRVDSLGVSAAAAALLYGILQSRQASLDKAP
jgi:23S rRNA (guanosine2251-2'-O)-methyltransferase